MQKKKRMLFGSGGPYIVFALCLLAAGVLGYQLFVPSSAADDGSGGEADTLIQAEQPRLPDSAGVDAPVSVTADDEPEDEPHDGGEQTAKDVAVIAEAPDVPAETAPRLRAPLEGKTIAAFSAEVLAYNEALDDWRTHSGVDIAAEEGTPVCAACDGTVLSVTEEPLMGVTVVLEHGGGFATTYACLGQEVYVSAGDSVQAGQSIGAVGSTAAGESAEPHLHFSVSKNGTLVNPTEYLS